MKTQFAQAFKLTLLCALFFAGIYTLVIYGIAQVIAPRHGEGEVVRAQGRIVGYVRVGQRFTASRYFWTRPSAVGYNASASGGSNKSSSNPEYRALVRMRIDSLLLNHPGKTVSQIPAELVTASGSGLDPDLSPAGALFQAERVARVRGLSLDLVENLIRENTTAPLFGLLGPEKINVLKLNLALDSFK